MHIHQLVCLIVQAMLVLEDLGELCEMKFSCIGYDIKTIRTNIEQPTLDATEWPQNEAVYSDALSRTGIVQNSLQLLQPTSHEGQECLFQQYGNRDDCCLIAVEIPMLVLRFCNDKWPDVDEISLSSRCWKPLGFDVCDIDGFFSIFHMGVLDDSFIRKGNNFDLKYFSIIQQVAGFLVPEHAPYVTIGLKQIFQQPIAAFSLRGWQAEIDL